MAAGRRSFFGWLTIALKFLRYDPSFPHFFPPPFYSGQVRPRPNATLTRPEDATQAICRAILHSDEKMTGKAPPTCGNARRRSGNAANFRCGSLPALHGAEE